MWPAMTDPITDRQRHEANRVSWNAATVAHNSHKSDQAGFLRNGGSTLFPEEIELLGDITGKRLVHMQCNAGQDTLSLAQRGAVVTGVDISDEAIDFATTLAADSGIPGTFVRSDIYDWFDAAQTAGERFDIAFCSYGAICWLSDLNRWAEGVAAVLVLGGRLVVVDFHPAFMMFDEQLKHAYSYFAEDEPHEWEEGVGDYVAMSGDALAPSGYREGVRDFKNPNPVHEYQWHLGALFTALLEAGMSIDQFHEYPFTNGAKFIEGMQEKPGRRMYLPSQIPSIPLMYGLVTTKRAAKS